MACKSCGADIKFIKTIKGNLMPVNMEPIAIIPTAGGDTTVITDKGVIVRGERVDIAQIAEGIAIAGYMSHFATCKYASKHRRRD